MGIAKYAFMLIPSGWPTHFVIIRDS